MIDSVSLNNPSQHIDLVSAAVDPIIHIKRDQEHWDILHSWQEALLSKSSPEWGVLEQQPAALLIKRGHGRSSWCVQVGQLQVFAKVFERVGGVERLKQRFLGSPATREWRLLKRTVRRGVPVPQPIALGRNVGPGDRQVLISAWLDHAQSLCSPGPDASGGLLSSGANKAVPSHRDRGRSQRSEHSDAIASADGTVLRSRAANPVGRAWPDDQNPECSPVEQAMGPPSELIQALAHLFALSHNRGFVHLDAHRSNILYTPTDAGGFEAWFVDVYGSKMGSYPASSRQAMRSLAQIAYSTRFHCRRTEWLRFLRQYLEERGLVDTFVRRNPSTQRSVVRCWWRLVAELYERHAKSLVRQRDRRLRRKGKFFAPLSLEGEWCRGRWSGVVTLTLEQRSIFPEPTISDRTISEWQQIFPPLLRQIDDEPGGDVGSEGRLQSDPGTLVWWRAENFMQRLRWILLESPARRAFEQCHRNRHRDGLSPLVLGYAVHTSGLLPDCCAVLFADNPPRKETTTQVQAL